VAGFVFLDSTPLWLACKPPGKPEADACRAWNGKVATVAMGNVKHLARFPGIGTRDWKDLAK